ncbi:MAG: hypothetical protein AAFP76_14460 [Bacteroidota bacterium]
MKMIQKLCIGLLCFGFGALQAQNEPVVEHSALDGTWYMITRFQETKIQMEGNQWSSQRLNEDGTPGDSDRDTIQVVEAYPNGLRLMYDVGRKRYGLALFSLNETKDRISITLVDEEKGKEDLQALAESFDISTVSEFREQRVIYSEEKRNALWASPGLDELTAADMKTVLTTRKNWETRMKEDYLSKNPQETELPYKMYRQISYYMDGLFIQKGYNPYKQVPYNFEEQFKDHPDIIKLLQE